MKFLRTEVQAVLLSGILAVSPFAASSAFAQSSATTGSTAAKTQSQPSAPAQGSPSNRPISTLAPGQPPPPAHPITMDQTKQMLDLMGFKKMEDANWSEMLTMSKARIPFMPPAVWTDVQTNLNGIDYSATMQPIYAKYLSQEDAAKALEFYGTPAGKRVLQAMPMMMAESLSASQQKGRQAANDAISAHRPEIEAAQKKYQEEHAPKTTPAPGNGSATPSQPASPSTTPAPSTPPPSTTKPQR